MTSMDHHHAPTNIIRNQAIGNRQVDPLPRLLLQLIGRAGQPATIERAVSRPWASALFEGRRHNISLRINGDDASGRAEAFRCDLGEVEWTLPGYFVADIHVDDSGVDQHGWWLDLSALTIRDW